MVALVTPMTADHGLDNEALARLVEFHIDNGTDAIVAVGTTGESATLTPAEHTEVIGQVVDIVAGRVPVIAGTGANSTREAVELSAEAAARGADACLLVTPYYNKPTQQGLYEHYRLIAQSVPLPLVLYNVPGRTACDMLPETVEKLSVIDNIVGIKEATGELERIRELVARCGADFHVISGEDYLALDTIMAGGKGVISVTANVAPGPMHRLCALALGGDEPGARKLDEALQDLHAALFVESNPIPVKWALYDMGLIPAGIRLPLTPLSAKYHERVRGAVQQALAVTN